MSGAVGRSVRRVDARDRVTGAAKYADDVTLDGALHGKILFSGRPHARIRAIDTSQAEGVEGLVAIFTAKDVPVNEYGLQARDQPVLCGPGSEKLGADVVRFEGDQVALIVAETELAAEKARALVHVEYEDLPVVTDPFEALKPGALPVHPPRLPSSDHPELATEGNLICHHQIRKGDVDAAWAEADVVVEATYRTPAQEHAYLQPEAGLAYIDGLGRVTVVAGGQWTWEDQHEIARALDLDLEHVRVVYPAIGGAFGGREDMSVQIVLALAAQRLQRAVQIRWTREESIVGHCKRHPMWLRCKWGATREGRLVAAQVRVVADGGAYCYTTNKVLGNTAVTCTGPYQIPHISVDVDGVYTNNVPSGAFRGFGAPQGIFAAESQMNKLAEALETDPVALRLKNLLREGSLSAMGTPLPGGVNLVEVTRTCARAAGWEEQGQAWRKPRSDENLTVASHAPGAMVRRPEAQRRGVGLAVAYKNVGFSFGYQESCWARIELRGGTAIEEARVYIGSAEVGQGAHTVICQMAAEALGIDLGQVELVPSDTATSPGSSGSASASRTTFMAGAAVQGAAREAMLKWDAEERPAAGEFTYLAPQTTRLDPVTGEGVPNLAYGYVAEAVTVEVDVETGQLAVVQVVCADDVGKAVNPQQVEGQIEGGVAQALGWATCEHYVSEAGRVRTRDLSTYLIPTVQDVPLQVVPIIVERPDPRAPWGVRGMGEMPFIPLAPALVAAVHDATGVWFDELPLTPERVLNGLVGRDAQQGAGGGARNA